MQFLYGNWLRLPIQTRHKVAGVFNIQKKGATHVVDNVVQNDGYPIGDVETALCIENLREYTGTSEGNPEVLWDLMLAKIEGRALEMATPKIIVFAPTPASPPIEIVAAKKSYYKPVAKKKATKKTTKKK